MACIRVNLQNIRRHLPRNKGSVGRTHTLDIYVGVDVKDSSHCRTPTAGPARGGGT